MILFTGVFPLSGIVLCTESLLNKCSWTDLFAHGTINVIDYCKNNALIFTSGIQGAASRIITSSFTLHLFVAQEIDFLIVGMQSWASSGQSNGREGQ